MLLGSHRDAKACGQTPNELQALLPQPGASGAPLDAVLITSSNITAARMELRRVHEASAVGTAAVGAMMDASADARGDADASGGSSALLEVDVECEDAPGDGAVCLGRPRELLEPNTRYEWRALLASGGPLFNAEGSDWRSFTTGTERDDAPIDARDVTIRVTRNERSPSPLSAPCGISHWVDVTYGNTASEPAVLHYVDYTPSYVMHANLLRPGAEPTSVTLYSPPECLEPALFDQAGHRTLLPRVCLEPATAESPTEPRGCALSAASHAPARPWPALALLALATAFGLRRRPRGADSQPMKPLRCPGT